MSTEAETGSEQDVSCPHCKKGFTAALMPGRRARGFKCPHCRLFIPLDRIVGAALPGDGG